MHIGRKNSSKQMDTNSKSQNSSDQYLSDTHPEEQRKGPPEEDQQKQFRPNETGQPSTWPQLQHVDQTCSLGGSPAVVVDSNSSFSNSNDPNESHLEGPDCNAGENRDIESDPDDTNSQSSEKWTTEVIAKDPMQYALRCLLGENASQLHFNSITKDQRGVLFDFIDSCAGAGETSSFFQGELREGFARICVEVSNMDTLLSKIRIKSDAFDSAKPVEIKVDYQWM
ncbi:hypothetical protein Nepgr_007820 [Nepenthes gracilis]|uniref:Uncharacterized protein n=1 Tax=Nepenthes gracilis TaxID=150966 RepID=A0AAD3S7K6_NEPGR|nr:hypothetical protein Nepgr_007820 [Nepenthes gracilis]